mmetsp:Transcript_126756/g.253407  ORF Transcript_126756/g.253407 Transcript_126756/m.253407 type:complete len:88 (-) Transcript_126756:86-349(-)
MSALAEDTAQSCVLCAVVGHASTMALACRLERQAMTPKLLAKSVRCAGSEQQESALGTAMLLQLKQVKFCGKLQYLRQILHSEDCVR